MIRFQPAAVNAMLLAMLSLPVAAQTSDSPNRVTALNNSFRAAYAQAKKDILTSMDAVIVASGDKLYLIEGDRREDTTTISPEYTAMKTVDHIPLALFVLLDKRVDKPLPSDVKDALRGLQQLGQDAMPEVAAGNYPESTRARLKLMLDQSAAFEQKALDKGVTRAELNGFIAAMRKPTLDNIYDATALELGAIDRQVQKWRKQLTPEQWEHLHVVVTGGHMPRERERRMQYFGALLGERREGQRLIFMEGSDDVDKALDLLATHILDESIGEQYFQDKWRMHRDLLSDAAAKYLRTHPPAKK